MIDLIFLAETQLPVTAIEIGVWIGCASFVLGIVRNVMGIKADAARMKQGTADTPVHLAHPVQFTETKEAALKLDVEGEFDEIDGQLTALRTHLDERFEQMLKAGERRAEKITERIDAEIRMIRQDIETRLNALHEKVNGVALHVSANDEAINNLKTQDYRHDQMIQGIQAKLFTGRKAS
jgi:hypothetical protein